MVLTGEMFPISALLGARCWVVRESGLKTGFSSGSGIS